MPRPMPWWRRCGSAPPRSPERAILPAPDEADVNLVGPSVAVLGGLCLFFVPGLVLLALLPRRDREALPLDEALFLMVATSVCASSWIALALAEAGQFSLARAAGVLAALALVALLIGRRRLGWPFPPAGDPR